MRIAMIGPPFIEIPPRRYGGTELFIANLARELCSGAARRSSCTATATLRCHAPSSGAIRTATGHATRRCERN